MMRPTLEAVPMGATGTVAASRSRLAMELRDVAEDLAGRVDRDELTFDEELRLGAALDEVVDAVLPAIMEAMDDVMTPRLEALPLHARLVLARARDRRELGLE